jgi:hypothetical protein
MPPALVVLALVEKSGLPTFAHARLELCPPASSSKSLVLKMFVSMPDQQTTFFPISMVLAFVIWITG